MTAANTERDAKITAAARLGQTHDAIAREHGLTRARVSQIVAAAKTPVSAEETQRQLIAERLRSRWDELEKIVQHPPEMHSAIGKIIFGSDGKPIINAAAITAAIKTQLTIEAQYRQMFGVDLGTRPGPILDEAHLILKAEITVARQYMDRQAPAPALAPLPPGYAMLPAEEQMRIQVGRGRAQVESQRAVIQGELAS